MATILLIDDNLPLRHLMSLALTRAGHHVLEAGDGKQGIRILQQQAVDILVTDIVMPDQDGLQTIPLARQQRPNLHIIAISGDSPTHAQLYLKMAGAFGAHRLLRKPFPLSDLLAAVNAAVSDQPTPP